MLKVTDLWLRKIVHYDKVHIPLTKNNGFVIITGHNQDSKISESQNNGSGKSLLLSSIPNLLYASAPMSTAKNSKKEMLDDPQSVISMAFENNEGTLVRVTQNSKNWVIEEYDTESSKYVDSGSRTINLQQEKIASHFPITETEFYSYVYIQSQLRLGFQVGKPAERLAFITEVFRLDSYDLLKRYFNKMLGKIKDEQTKYDVIQAKLVRVMADLDAINWSDKKQHDLDECKERLVVVKESHSVLSKQIAHINSILHGVNSLIKLDTKFSEISRKHRDLINDYGGPAKTISYMRKQLSIIQENNNYSIKLEHLTEQRKRLQSDIRELEEKIDDLDIKSSVEKRRECVRKLENLLEISRTHTDTLKKKSKLEAQQEEVLSELREHGYERVDDVDMETDIESDIAVYKTTLQLKALLKHGGGECPTCHQEVDLALIEKSVRTATNRLKKLESLDKARSLVCSLKSLSKNVASLDSPSDKQMQDLNNSINKLRSDIDGLTTNISCIEKLIDLKQQFDSIVKPKPPKAKPDPGYTEEIVQLIIEACHHIDKIEHSISTVLESHRGLKEEIDKLGLKGVLSTYSKESTKLEKHLKEITEEQSKLIKYVSKMDLKLGQYKVLSKQRDEYSTEMQTIQPLIDMRDLYKGLEQAYGSKGLKVERADEIVAVLEANLNQYRHLIFAEAFAFRVYADDSGIHCDVDRGNGKVSDVRLLSGAESDCFRMLFLLSMLVLVPDSRRTNFVVLDEPDSHMDIATKELFRDSFLPHLREVVPHIFLITPGDPHFYNDFEHWQVVKSEGVSNLERM